jgi:hypothetical protein
MSVLIKIIKQKLKEYQAIKGVPNHHSSKTWEYNWNPATISIDQVKKLEDYYKIEIPKEYKLFLTEIANGGLGPTYYPLYDLHKSIEKSIPEYTTCSFPLKKPLLRVGTKETFYEENYKSKTLEEIEESYKLRLKFCYEDMLNSGIIMEADNIEEYIYDLPEGVYETDATLFIGESGCGLDFYLVLKGEHSGEVWHSREGGIGPYSSSFLSFIEDWLDAGLNIPSKKAVLYYIENNQLEKAKIFLKDLNKNPENITYVNDELVILGAMINAVEKSEFKRFEKLKKIIEDKNQLSTINYLLKECTNHFYESLDSLLEDYTYEEFEEKKKALLKSGIFDWEFNYALNEANKILAIIPESATTKLDVTLFYFNMKNYEKYLEWDKNNNTENLFVENTRGCFALDNGEAKKATIYFKNALKIKENWLPGISNLALAYSFLGKYEKAELILKDLIDKNPNYEWSYLGMALNCLLQEKFTEGFEWLHEAVIDKSFELWQVASDPVWSKWTNYPEYKKIVKEYKE